MKNCISILVGIPFALALTGCQQLGQVMPASHSDASAPAAEPATVESAASAPSSSPEKPKQYAELSGDMLFDILVGEIAGQRNQLDVSVEHYLQAAEGSEDPRVAERALRIAVFAKDEEAALAAARRWVELDPDRLEARQSLAVLALRAGIEDEALEQLEKIVTDLGTGDQAFKTVTGLLARDEDRKAALQLMQRLADRYPDLPDAQLALSRLAQHAGEPDRGLAAIQRALELRPDWPEAIIQRARLRAQNGNREQALDELSAAVEAQPDEVDLRLTYARLLLEQHDFAAARKQFEVVVKHDPEHADALYSLGLLTLESEEYATAKKYFKRLLELGEHEQEARYYLGRIAESQDDAKTAIEWYDRVREGEYLIDAQIRSARLRAQRGNLGEARQQLHGMRVRHPQFAVQLYVVEGELLDKAGEEEQAMDLYNSVLEEMPDNPDLLYSRALLAEQMDDLEMAERDLRRVVELEPDNAHALNALGYTLADRTDRYSEALIYIEKALSMAPEEPAILDSMGWVKYRLGDLEEAEQYLRKALELNQDAEIAAHLGEVLWQQGKHDEARKVWNAAQERGTDNPVLEQTMQRFLKP